MEYGCICCLFLQQQYTPRDNRNVPVISVLECYHPRNRWAVGVLSGKFVVNYNEKIDTMKKSQHYAEFGDEKLHSNSDHVAVVCLTDNYCSEYVQVSTMFCPYTSVSPTLPPFCSCSQTLYSHFTSLVILVCHHYLTFSCVTFSGHICSYIIILDTVSNFPEKFISYLLQRLLPLNSLSVQFT